MELTSKRWFREIFMLSPYIGVLTAMYLFKNAFLAIAIYHFGIITALIIYRKEIDVQTLFSRKRTFLAVPTLLLCALSGVVIAYFWSIVQKPTIDLNEMMTLFKLGGINKWIFLAYFATIHPFIEELYWRFILNAKSKYLSYQDILFASYHLLVVQFFVQPLYLVWTFFGLLISARFWRYLHQNLHENRLVFFSHLIADFSIMFCIFKLC